MSKNQSVLLQPAMIGVLAACAGQPPVERQAAPDVAEIAKLLGCTDEEVTVCVDVNCKPREYQYASKVDVKASLGVRDYPRP